MPVRDGYAIEQNDGEGWKAFAAYGVDEPAAINNARWYNGLLRGRKIYRVILRVGGSVVVIYAR